MPVSGLPPALENALEAIIDDNMLTSWRISGGSKFVNVSLRFQVADMTGSTVFNEPRTFRTKPPSQVKRDTTRRAKWYAGKHETQDDKSDRQSILDSSLSTTTSTTELKHISGDNETGSDSLGGQSEPCSQALTNVTQIPQSTDQATQVKVTELE